MGFKLRRLQVLRRNRLLFKRDGLAGSCIRRRLVDRRYRGSIRQRKTRFRSLVVAALWRREIPVISSPKPNEGVRESEQYGNSVYQNMSSDRDFERTC